MKAFSGVEWTPGNAITVGHAESGGSYFCARVSVTGDRVYEIIPRNDFHSLHPFRTFKYGITVPKWLAADPCYGLRGKLYMSSSVAWTHSDTSPALSEWRSLFHI